MAKVYSKVNWGTNTQVGFEPLDKMDTGIDAIDTKLDASAISDAGPNFIRWENGNQICWGKFTGSINVVNAWGSLYTGVDPTVRTFPKSFVVPPTVDITVSATSTSSFFQVSYNIFEINNSGFWNINICRPTSALDVPYKVDYIAAGRWKY